jgi:hypothetical protein
MALTTLASATALPCDNNIIDWRHKFHSGATIRGSSWRRQSASSQAPYEDTQCHSRRPTAFQLLRCCSGEDLYHKRTFHHICKILSDETAKTWLQHRHIQTCLLQCSIQPAPTSTIDELYTKNTRLVFSHGRAPEPAPHCYFRRYICYQCNGTSSERHKMLVLNFKTKKFHYHFAWLPDSIISFYPNFPILSCWLFRARAPRLGNAPFSLPPQSQLSQAHCRHCLFNDSSQ